MILPMSITFSLHYFGTAYHRTFYFNNQAIEWCSINPEREFVMVNDELRNTLEQIYHQCLASAMIAKQASRN